MDCGDTATAGDDADDASATILIATLPPPEEAPPPETETVIVPDIPIVTSPPFSPQGVPQELSPEEAPPPSESDVSETVVAESPIVTSPPIVFPHEGEPQQLSPVVLVQPEEDGEPIITLITKPTASLEATNDDDGDDCAYYPGWNIGLEHCLRDCHQPPYMRQNPIFEFNSLADCCSLHFQGRATCTIQSQMAEKILKSAQLGLPSLSGQVWEDTNGNGIQDYDERTMANGIAGVYVNLHECTPGVVGSNTWVKGTLTAADGSYILPEISLDKSYYAQISVPRGYHLLGDDPLSDGKYDKKFMNDGRSQCMEFASGMDDVAFNAGLIPNGDDESMTTINDSAGYPTHSKSYLRGDSSAGYTSTGGEEASPKTTSTLPTELEASISPTDDTTIHSNGDITYSGGQSELHVGHQATWRVDILLKFDVAAFTLAHRVDYVPAKKAMIRLYSLSSSPSGGQIHMGSSNSWYEDTVMWSTAPEADEEVIATIGRVFPHSWVELDVTELLLTSSLTSDGIATLRITSEESNHVWVAKYSSTKNEKYPGPELRVYS